MINLTKHPSQVSFDSQVLAFRWYQNIGDPLSHFAHFASFVSEAQKQSAMNLVKSYSMYDRLPELQELFLAVSTASIRLTRTISPTIVLSNKDSHETNN